MRLKFVLPAVLIGAGLLLPVQTPASAKTSYKQHKYKKFKTRKFKAGKGFKGHKVARHKVAKH
ncbi:MAG: hypothetical protein ABSC93_02275 [Bryobacteraceae bacterium]|jgi:hypothetical protein